MNRHLEPGKIRWKPATKQACVDLANELKSGVFTNQQLIDAKLDWIIDKTGCFGETIPLTLNRALQDLRNLHELEFLGNGQYRLLNWIPTETITEIEDIIDKIEIQEPVQIKERAKRKKSHAITKINNKPLLDLSKVGEKVDMQVVYTTVTVKQRRNTDELREQTLANYEGKCAICGFDDKGFLDSCHIVPVSQNIDIAGYLANTIALCKLDHYLFDKGAFIIDENLNLKRTSIELSKTMQAWLDNLPDKISPAAKIQLNKDFLQSRRELVEEVNYLIEE